MSLRIKKLEADIQVRSGFAATRLVMTFQNELRAWKPEVEFFYSAPPESIVTYFAYWFRDEKVVARVVEKERAALIYSTLTQWGVDPALIEMVGKNTFRARIFPVFQGDDLKVELRYVQALRADRDGFYLDFPLRQQQQQTALPDGFNSGLRSGPKSSVKTPGSRGTYESLRLKVRVLPDSNITGIANNYNLPVRAEGGARRLDLAQLNYRPPADLRLRLKRRAAPLQTSLFAARAGGRDGFFALSLCPDRALSNVAVSVSGVRTWQVLPARPGAVKAHQSFTLCGRYRGAGPATVLVRGMTPGGPVTLRAPLHFSARREAENLATRLWAARRIEALGVSEKNRAQIIALSQRYTLPSRYTSWLAIPKAEEESYKRIEKEARVASWLRGLAGEILLGRGQSATARRLRRQIAAAHNEPWRDRNSSVDAEVTRVLYGMAYNLSSEWVEENLSLKPDKARLKALRGQLAHVTNVINKRRDSDRFGQRRNVEQRLEETQRWRAQSRLRELATELVNERHMEKPDADRLRSLQTEIKRVERVSGQSGEGHVRAREAQWARHKSHQLAYYWAEQKRAAKPDAERMAQLRRQLEELSKITGAKPSRFTDMALSNRDHNYRTGPNPFNAELAALREKAVAELKKPAADAARLRELQTDFKQLHDRGGYEEAMYSWWWHRNDWLEATAEELARLRERIRREGASAKLNQYETLEQHERNLLARVGGFSFRVGDPLISIEAPADARQVVAVLPGGEVKRLLFDAQKKRWEARFDIPTYASEGDYAITIIVVQKDGARRQFMLRYRVDMTAPHSIGHEETRLLASRGGSGAGETTLRLELDASSDTTRVAALLPWGDKADLKPSTAREHRFFALIPIPRDWIAKRGAAAVVTYILTDRAHNRTTVTIDLSK